MQYGVQEPLGAGKNLTALFQLHTALVSDWASLILVEASDSQVMAKGIFDRQFSFLELKKNISAQIPSKLSNCLPKRGGNSEGIKSHPTVTDALLLGPTSFGRLSSSSSE